MSTIEYSERYVLACMMLEPHRVREAKDLSTSDFLRRPHAELYARLLALSEDDHPLDTTTVVQGLSPETLKALGGFQGLHTLVLEITSTAFFTYHVGLVQRSSYLRRMRGVAGTVSDLAERCSPQEEAVQSFREQASSLLLGALDATSAQERYQMWSAGPERVLGVLKGSGAQGIKTGLKPVDEVLGGLFPRELVVIGARPGVGKSALALSLCFGAMRKAPELNVLFFSLEMDREVVTDRLLSFLSGVPYTKIHRSDLHEGDRANIARHADGLRDLRMTVIDDRGNDLLRMKNQARRAKLEHGVDLIVVDYLQLVTMAGRHESRWIEVGKITRGLRQMSKEFDCPVLALAQLRRESENHTKEAADSRPRLSDLRESGDIEQDADSVILLHRPGLLDPSLGYNKTELLVAKNRHGPTGMGELDFDGPTTRFRNTL